MEANIVLPVAKTELGPRLINMGSCSFFPLACFVGKPVDVYSVL